MWGWKETTRKALRPEAITQYLLAVIMVTIIITVSDVIIAEWENFHETPLSEAH